MDPMVIPLDADAVLSPSKFHLGVVFAYMVFPDDDEMRTRAMETAAVEDSAERMLSGTLPQSQMRELVLVALNATSPRDLQEQSGEQVDLACAAGLILYNACLTAFRGESNPLKSVKDEIDKIIGKQKRGTSSNVDNVVWKSYKSVAPFWAAYLYFDGLTMLKKDELPCNRRDFSLFLHTSEEMRHIGERTKSKNGRPILMPGDCFRLPNEIIALLPAVNLTAVLD